MDLTHTKKIAGLVGESLSSGLQDNSDVMSRSLLIDTVAPAILKAAVLRYQWWPCFRLPLPVLSLT